MWNFGITSVPVYADRGLYGMAAKKLKVRNFLETSARGCQIFFIGVSLKVYLNFTIDRTGAPLMPFSRGKRAT